MKNKLQLSGDLLLETTAAIRTSLIFCVVSVILIIASAAMFKDNMTVQMFIYAVAIAVAGHETAIYGIERLLSGKLSERLLVTACILTLFCLGFSFAAACVTVAYSLEQIFFTAMRIKAGNSYRAYNGEKTVNVKQADGSITAVRLSDIKTGDILIISDGEEVPVTGSDDNGKEYVAGLIYDGDAIHLTVTKKLEQKIPFEQLHLEKENQSETGRKIKKVSAVLSVIIFVAAAIFVFVISKNVGIKEQIARMLGVVVVASPSAVKLSATLSDVLMNAIMKFCGFINPTADIAFSFASVKNFVATKTGIATIGAYKIGDVVCAPEYDREFVLSLISAAEENISHPIAKAFSDVPANIEVSDANYIRGNGICAKYKDKNLYIGSAEFMKQNGADTVGFPDVAVYIALDKAVIGSVKMLDRLAPDARVAIAILQTKMRTVLISADNETTTAAVASKCAFSEHYSALDAQDKAEKIRQIRGRGKTVAFGNPDDLSIERADIPVYKGNSPEGSNAVCLNGGLAQLAKIITTAKKVKITVVMSVILSVLAKIFVVYTTCNGLLPVWAVVAIDALINSICVYAVVNEIKY